MGTWRRTRFAATFGRCEDCIASNNCISYRLRAQLDHDARHAMAEYGFVGDQQVRFGVLLFKFCAERTYPLWERVAGQSDLVNFSTMIDRLLEAEISRSRFLEYFNKENATVQNMIYEWDEVLIDQAGVAGMSCTTAMAYSLNAFEFDQDAETESETDTSNWDSAFLSSIAEAGGAEWQAHERELDNKARERFWRWYLDEAVPQSFEQAKRKTA